MSKKDINTTALDNGPLAEKRAWLRETVDRLKREQSLSQKDIAERVGDTPPEMSGRLKPGGRAIPDAWLDRFQKEFKVTFEAGNAPRNAPAPDQFAGERDRYLRIIEALQEELRECRASARAVNDLVERLDRSMALQGAKA